MSALGAKKLEAIGLCAQYGTGRRALMAVRNADVAIPEKGTLGVVGESGCGKSTLARAVVGLVPIVGGRLLLGGLDVTSNRIRGDRKFRQRVQIVFQDPYSSLNPRMTVEEALLDAFTSRPSVPRRQRRGEVVGMLERVGLGRDALTAYPHQFSGGQRQRIAIARALMVRPEVLILDEVTSALDVSVQGTILNLLKDLQVELGLSYLFISHDLSVVRSMSDVVSVMYLGEVVESSPTDELFRAARHPYTRSLIASIPQLGQRRALEPLRGELPDPHNAPTGCRFRTRCPIGPLTYPERTVCIEQEPARVDVGASHWATCHFLGGPSQAQRVEAGVQA